jgi:aspartate racemase
MKTIGLIGGITWHSTIDYYRLINQLSNDQLGGVSSAKIILYSIEFGNIKNLTELQRWDDLSDLMNDAALKLEKAGADCILICANTMHNVAGNVQRALKIPLIHIATETAKSITSAGLKKVALLGTKYTMQLDFYKNKLVDYGISTIIPDNEVDVEYLNDAIYQEMGKGIFRPETKSAFLKIIDKLIARGAEGIVLGCTEIPILIKQEDCRVPVFDTTGIHVRAAIDFALSKELSSQKMVQGGI